MSSSDEAFSDSERKLLLECPSLLDVIRITFFYNSTESFLALCSLITHGKNCASPNKKIRRAARQELFSKIAYETFPIKNHANIKLSYFEIITGLQSLSERWCKYSYDELLSLVFVLDMKNKGSVSNEEFETFTELVEVALYKDPSKHVEAFTALHETLKANVVTAGNDDSINQQLRNKLTALANRARYLEQTPLTMMYSLSEEYNHNCPNEAFVELLDEMVVFTKKHRLKIEKTTTIDLNASSTSHPISRRNSISSSPGKDSLVHGTLFGSNDSNVESVNSFTTPVKGQRRSSIHTSTPSKEVSNSSFKSKKSISPNSTKFNEQFESSLSIRKPSVSSVNGSAVENGKSAEISPTEVMISGVPSKTTASTSETNNAKESLNSTTISNANPPIVSSPSKLTDVGVSTDATDESRIKDMLVDKLKIFKAKADQISTSLSTYDEQLTESNQIWQNLQQMQQELQQTQEMYKKSISNSKSNDNIKLSSANSNTTEDAKAVNPPSPQKKNKPINPFSPPVAVTPIEATKSESADIPPATSESGVISLADAKNIDTFLNTNAVSPKATVAPPSIISSIAPASVALNESDIISKPTLSKLDKTNYNNISSSTISTNGSVHSYSTLGTQNRSKRDTSKISAYISKYQSPPTVVNMSIFKTPVVRQKHPNKNTFDAKNVCWMPTKVSNRYNERFQYPSDLRIADKINSVFYNQK